MKDIVNNFKNQIIANGISQGDVKLLEETLGEKPISSNINIKHFTTERSDIAVSEALSVLEHYKPETSTEEKVYTQHQYFNVYNDYVLSLQKLSDILAKLTTVYSEDKKNVLFNLKHRWTWNNSDGSTETGVWDMFSKKYEMSQIIRSNSLIYETCGNNTELVSNKITEFIYNLDKLEENTNVNWEIGGFDTFISMGLILNEEIDSYIDNMSFTPVKLSGEDLFNFLDNIYKHYEYVLGISKECRSEYISQLSRNETGKSIYVGNIKKIERMEFLISKNKITVEFLNIVKAIFDSMSNQ